ncbi:transposase [Paenibacillus sp. S150]|uniref:transposase n=1 Tax=Paenibacillus sp. S150 TaxID=2749826 RepID=UPI002815EFE3|nr:transposase [Paenibacillus sp. S150]
MLTGWNDPPGHDESAEKKRSAKTRKGNKKLRSALVESARAAGGKKNTYLSAQYHRIAGRRGKTERRWRSDTVF